MQTLALFGGVVVILMIWALFVPVSFSRIRLNWLRPSNVWQVMDLWNESLIGDVEEGEYNLLLLPVVSPLVSLPQLVWRLRTPSIIILGWMISDQNLLRSCSDIVFKHRIFVCSPEQVIHRRRWLLWEGLKNGISRLMFAWRSVGWHPYCKIQFGAPFARTASWSPLATHSPATWCFVGCLCSAFGKRNIGSGLQRLTSHLGKCSQNFTGGGGTRRELVQVGWSVRLCTSVHHSLCWGS